MRKHLTASAALAIAILAAACGGGNSPVSGSGAVATCVHATAAHKAYLVVTHLDGTSVQKCVGFDGDQINGEDLMKQSGIEFQAQTFSFGKGVCQIDNEPAQFTDCFPKDMPYWALFTDTAAGPWTAAQTAYTAVNLKAGDGMGWRYTPVTASPAPTPGPPKE